MGTEDTLSKNDVGIQGQERSQDILGTERLMGKGSSLGRGGFIQVSLVKKV